MKLGDRLTTPSCTAPQKQVAVASVSLEYPSLAIPDRGNQGFDLSTLAAIANDFVGYLKFVYLKLLF